MGGLTCAKAPCKTCPYRRDVPSGVWATEEYDKLPAYDGDIPEQIAANAIGVFMCHQQDGKICAGWIGTHGAHNLAAVRLSRSVDPAVAAYQSPVPLFASGAEAAAHGKRDMHRPGELAQRALVRLSRKLHDRLGDRAVTITDAERVVWSGPFSTFHILWMDRLCVAEWVELEESGSIVIGGGELPEWRITVERPSAPKYIDLQTGRVAGAA